MIKRQAGLLLARYGIHRVYVCCDSTGHLFSLLNLPAGNAPGASSVALALLLPAALLPAAARDPSCMSAAMSTFDTAASTLADGVRCTRGGVGLLFAAAAADGCCAATSLSRARLDWKLFAAMRLGLEGAFAASGGLPAGQKTCQHNTLV